jgi:CRP-like cAMP-binding protein
VSMSSEGVRPASRLGRDDRVTPAGASPADLSPQVARHGQWLACCLSRGVDAPLNPGDIAQLAMEIGERHVPQDSIVFSAGDATANVHIIRRGTVELSRVVNGRRVIIQMLEPGDVFGDVSAFLHHSEHYDARAATDSVILSIAFEALFELLRTRPRMAQRWFVSLAERLAGLQDRLADLLAGNLDAQVASTLLRVAAGSGEVRLTHTRLAGLLGVQRRSVQRVLKSMEFDGLVGLRYGKVRLQDVAGLRRVAGVPVV